MLIVDESLLFFQTEMLNNCLFHLLKCKNLLLTLSSIIVNEETLGFGLLMGQQKNFEDDTFFPTIVDIIQTEKSIS